MTETRDQCSTQDGGHTEPKIRLNKIVFGFASLLQKDKEVCKKQASALKRRDEKTNMIRTDHHSVSEEYGYNWIYVIGCTV